jgi:hypothetical protein
MSYDPSYPDNYRRAAPQSATPLQSARRHARSRLDEAHRWAAFGYAERHDSHPGCFKHFDDQCIVDVPDRKRAEYRAGAWNAVEIGEVESFAGSELQKNGQ